MGVLPDDPRSQKALLSIVAAGAIGAAFYLYVYSPKQDTLEEDEARLEQLDFLNQEANARIGNLDALRDELRTRRSRPGTPTGAALPRTWRAGLRSPAPR